MTFIVGGRGPAHHREAPGCHPDRTLRSDSGSHPMPPWRRACDHRLMGATEAARETSTATRRLYRASRGRVAGGAGVVLLWRQADGAQRARFRAATRTHRWNDALRAGLGVALVAAGGGAILFGAADLNGTAGGIVAALVVASGLALITAP